MKKQAIIVANWKMHKTAAEAASFIKAVAASVQDGAPDSLLFAVPFTAIQAAVDAASGSSIKIGAQNMHEAEQGAYTGEISAAMLHEAGASFVILGHSERRRLFGESDVRIRAKVKRALASGLRPLLCIGETLEEREAGEIEQVLERQLESAFEGLSYLELERLLIAYEPVWAIGTGLSATPSMAQEAHRICRAFLEKFGAGFVPLLYGGSVKAEMMRELMAEKDIDGVLVGNAALQLGSLLQIINWRNL